MATHSSVLAWRIPGLGEPGGLSGVSGVAQSQTRLKQLSSSSVAAAAGTQCLSMERVDYFAILVFVPDLMKVHFEFPTP